MEIVRSVSAEELRGVDIFASLSNDILEKIAGVCIHRTYEAGEYCAVQGKTTDQLLIVNSGKVDVEMRIDVPRYSHTVTTAVLTKGHVCAWSAIVPPHVLTASIRCVERTQMIGVKDSDLQRIFEEKPSVESVVMRNLAAVISSRLKDTREQLIQLVAEVIKESIRQGL